MVSSRAIEMLSGEIVKNKPFFYAIKCGDQIITKDIHRCFLGHKIPKRQDIKSDGIFVEWQWERDRLTLWNGRYGIYPTYYCHKGDEIWISPSIIKLIMEGASTELDYMGLSVFLWMGFFIFKLQENKAWSN